MDAAEEAMAMMDQEVMDRWHEEQQEDLERHAD